MRLTLSLHCFAEHPSIGDYPQYRLKTALL